MWVVYNTAPHRHTTTTQMLSTSKITVGMRELRLNRENVSKWRWLVAQQINGNCRYSIHFVMPEMASKSSATRCLSGSVHDMARYNSLVDREVVMKEAT